MSQLQRFSFDRLAVSRWRNGGGETREIISWPPETADFSWRVSIATIAQDGPFSAFPAIDRSITLLSGAGVHLFSAPDIDHALVQQGQPFAFSGDRPLQARLIDGATTDFNIMTRRGVCNAAVTVHRQGMTKSGSHSQPGSFELLAMLGGVLYVMEGRWVVDHDIVLHAGEGLYWVNSQNNVRSAQGVTLEEKPGIRVHVDIQSSEGMIIAGAINP